MTLLVLTPSQLLLYALLPSVLRNIRLHQVQRFHHLLLPTYLALNHFNVLFSIQKSPLFVKGVLCKNSLYLTFLIHVQGVLEHRIYSLILATLT